MRQSHRLSGQTPVIKLVMQMSKIALAVYLKSLALSLNRDSIEKQIYSSERDFLRRVRFFMKVERGKFMLDLFV